MQNNLEFIIPTSKEISIYIHWPFCTKKCPYCDFNSYTFDKIDHQLWIKSYFKAIENQSKFFANKRIKSIFFGGGTPSLMDPKNIEQLIDYFQNHNLQLKFPQIEEITLEANPSTFEIAKFKAFKNAGINRISIGIQSFFDDNLKFLGRNHNALEGIKALEESRKIFNKMSFDLIVGLPNQSFDNIKSEVNYALEFFQGHLSLYQLTIEEGTLFYKNKIQTIDETNEEKFYTYIVNTLYEKNIFQYEISNFAIENNQSIHNLNYWLGGEYVGIGPNASGRVFFNNQWISVREYKNPAKWIQHINNPIEEYQALSPKERFEEMIITALRVNKPLDIQLYKLLNPQKINKLLQENLVVKSGDSIITTHKGKMCLNYVITNLLT